MYHDNSNEKKSGVVTLISEKLDFRINITNNKGSHFIMIKGSINEEDLTILIVYTFYNRASRQN